MSDPEERIYDSGPARPDDEFWLAQGQKMVESSLPAVREAAKALMTGLGVLQGIYLAILGFGEVSKKISWDVVGFLALPLVAWMVAVLFCLRVIMTSPYEIHLQSPESIRDNHRAVLRTRQADLWYAYAGLALGLLLAAVVIACMPVFIYSA
jgi:hypothetical protein